MLIIHVYVSFVCVCGFFFHNVSSQIDNYMNLPSLQYDTQAEKVNEAQISKRNSAKQVQ